MGKIKSIDNNLMEMTGKKKSTHIRIMHIAKLLFEKKGLEGVTIDDISQQAQICRSTFFNHFASINELLKEIANQEITDLLSESYNCKEKGVKLIQKVMDKLVDDTVPYPYLTIQLLMSLILSKDEQNHLMQIEKVILDELSKIGVNDEYSPIEAVSLIFGAFYGVVFQQFINKKPIDNASNIKSTINKMILCLTKRVS